MPTFDYLCEQHGYFEVFWQERKDSQPCPKCGADSEQRWRHFPNVDATAFAAWNPDASSDARTFTDKAKYREHLKRSGSTPYERGMDADAEANHKRICDQQMAGFREKLGQWFQDRSLDEIRKMIKVDAQIYDAQCRGDANAIHAMGGLTSLDDLEADAKSHEPITLKAIGSTT